MHKIIVTGATGFIGSRICKRLVEYGHKVSIIARATSSYENLYDIEDSIDIFIYDGNIDKLISYFQKNKFDTVIHLASACITEHSKDTVDVIIDSNIKFSTHILEAMKYSNCKKIINTSTYGQHYNNEAYNPSSLYSATKEAFENIIKFYSYEFFINCITLELFDTYGEFDNRSKILNILEEYSNKDKILNVSEGNQIMDLLYIDDVVDAYIVSIDLLNEYNYTEPKKYSLQSNNRVTLKELINMYQNITKNYVNINWGGRPYKSREIMIPWNKGEVLPNWEPKYTLEEGLKKAFLK